MKLSFYQHLTYGVAGIGDAIIYNLTGTFLIFFLNTVVGMNPALAGAVAAVGAIWETLWGGAMGYISDNTHTRMGRRKPFILAGAIPMAIVTALTFTAIDVPEAVRFLYYCLMLILYWTCFMTFFVPYLAWGADLTDDYDERTVLRGYTFIFDALGATISMALPTILVDVLVGAGTGKPVAWTTVGFLCGAVSAVTILYMGISLKDRDQRSWEEEHEQKAGFRGTLLDMRRKEKRQGEGFLLAMAEMGRNFVDIFRLDAARYIMLASTMYLVGYAMFCADRIYYLNYNMELAPWQITFILIYMSILTILYVPVLNLLCARFDKRSVYISGMLMTAVLMCIAGFLEVSTFWQMLLIGAVFNIANSCYWQLVPAMIYDVCEADELSSGKKRGGIVVSLQSLAESAGNAIGMQVLGFVLALGEFDESASTQSLRALSLIDAALTFLPAVFMALSAWMVLRYPITKARYAEILRQLGR